MPSAQTLICSQPGQREKMDHLTHFRRGSGKNAIDRSCLVVDDDTNIMRLVAEMLAELGYRVDMEEDGQKALQKIYARRYDIVLSDLEMPLINGFLLVSRIKSYTSDTQTLIMTGRCHAEVLGLMTPAIVDAWLFKPFTMDELCEVLEDLRIPLSSKTAAV
jgi:DNA-binding response OmpR family regulator